MRFTRGNAPYINAENQPINESVSKLTLSIRFFFCLREGNTNSPKNQSINQSVQSLVFFSLFAEAVHEYLFAEINQSFIM